MRRGSRSIRSAAVALFLVAVIAVGVGPGAKAIGGLSIPAPASPTTAASSPSIPFSVHESGLPAGTLWTIAVSTNTSTRSTPPVSTPYLNGSLLPGMYWLIPQAAGYGSTPFSVLVRLSTQSVAANVTFVPGGSVVLTVSPITASIRLDGTPFSLGLFPSNRTIAFAPGIASVEVTSPGFLPYWNNVSVTAGVSIALNVTLYPVPPAPGEAAVFAASLGVVLIAAGLVLLAVATYRLRHDPRQQARSRIFRGDPDPIPWVRDESSGRRPPPPSPPPG